MMIGIDSMDKLCLSCFKANVNFSKGTLKGICTTCKGRNRGLSKADIRERKLTMLRLALLKYWGK